MSGLVFTDLRAKWLEALVSTDRNSIRQHIWRMMHYASSFHIFNELIRLSPEVEGKKQFNWILADLVQNSYSIMQLMGVRALVERRDDTNSLYNLLKEIRENTHLVTRESVFKVLGIRSDIDEVKRKYEAFMTANSGAGAVTVPNDINPEIAIEVHERFDKWSKVNKDNRQDTDTIDVALIDSFIELLEKEPDRIRKHCNKLVAHLAPQADRSKLTLDEINITYGDIKKSHRSIVSIICELELLLNNSVSAVSGIYDSGVFDFLDKPLLDPKDLDEIKSSWDKYRKDLNNWDSLV